MIKIRNDDDFQRAEKHLREIVQRGHPGEWQSLVSTFGSLWMYLSERSSDASSAACERGLIAIAIAWAGSAEAVERLVDEVDSLPPSASRRKPFAWKPGTPFAAWRAALIKFAIRDHIADGEKQDKIKERIRRDAVAKAEAEAAANGRSATRDGPARGFFHEPAAEDELVTLPGDKPRKTLTTMILDIIESSSSPSQVCIVVQRRRIQHRPWRAVAKESGFSETHARRVLAKFQSEVKAAVEHWFYPLHEDDVEVAIEVAIAEFVNRRANAPDGRLSAGPSADRGRLGGSGTWKAAPRTAAVGATG